jgi:hypothetical protein
MFRVFLVLAVLVLLQLHCNLASAQAAGPEHTGLCNFAKAAHLKGDASLIVRSRPSMHSSEIGRLPLGAEVYVCDERRDWLQVFYGGQTLRADGPPAMD